MTIAIQGKTYELFPKGWINVEVTKVEDKGMMSYNSGDDPKPKLAVHFKPEGSQDNSTTISVLCTNSCHRDATLYKIVVAAVRRAPRRGEDVEALLMRRQLKALNDHRVNSKDNLAYNKLRDFAPADPFEEQDTKPSTKLPGKPEPRTKKARGNGVTLQADPNELKDTEITDADVPF